MKLVIKVEQIKQIKLIHKIFDGNFLVDHIPR
jgi:hypothetical protein